ncbi:cytochrome P450 [Exidia glandulosa HHB12029]|uniref:sterol 22-desaturase n=1 Tax=Exidia glandulosa HHB12029 TaxID=1314781 RepID=A0A165K109_EXIGL|nr:cytochrome P450 [Exidia glandulosa HHB12029]
MATNASNTLYAALRTLPVQLPDQVTGGSVWYTVGAVVASLLVLEQLVYRTKKGHLPGPRWTIPIIGKFADSRSPTLEKYIESWKSGALSAVSVFNIFIVMSATNEYSRKIFNSPKYAEPCLVASAKQVLCPDNWVFLNGKAHVEYRRILNTLFTRKALSIYLQTQDAITRQHFARWLIESELSSKPGTLMNPIRDLNMVTSLRVFCGSHIPDHAIATITEKYWVITCALQLVNFPLAIPGTATYRAIQARKEAMVWLEAAAASSKRAMAEGKDVECLLDAWVMEINEARKQGKMDREFSDREMALVVLSFLFASQDAMSSGLIYFLQHLADHPDVLAKVREEQERVRGGDFERPTTLEMLDAMPYIKACVKETLRLRPPVTMVPYKATRPFPISEDYTVPKNTIIIPSLYPSVMDEEVYPEPEKFLPDRWLDPESPANANPQQYLVFGSGPHRCIGVEYVMMHMSVVGGVAACLLDWTHHVTPDSEKTQMIATIFPKDGCIVSFRPRKHD